MIVVLGQYGKGLKPLNRMVVRAFELVPILERFQEGKSKTQVQALTVV